MTYLRTVVVLVGSTVSHKRGVTHHPVDLIVVGALAAKVKCHDGTPIAE